MVAPITHTVIIARCGTCSGSTAKSSTATALLVRPWSHPFPQAPRDQLARGSCDARGCARGRQPDATDPWIEHLDPITPVGDYVVAVGHCRARISVIAAAFAVAAGFADAAYWWSR